MNEITVSHLHGHNGVTEKIRKAMYEAAKEFVYIGFLLKEVRDYKYYEEGSYENVYDYAEFELGFKRSSTKNFIAIAETFGIQKYTYNGIPKETQTMSLQTEYEKFNYSQLVEMLAMSSAQRAQATPDMTVRQLREIKKEPAREEPKIDFKTLDKAIAWSKTSNAIENKTKSTGQTSGQVPELFKWNEWISINQGLPETDKRVLVCCETKAGVQNINLAYYDGQAWHGSGSMAGVTHWMELPGLPMIKRDQEALQAVVVNNYWSEINPIIITKLLNIAHLKYSPKSCYKIEIQLKKDNG